MSERRILHAADIHLDSPLQKLDAYEHAPVDLIRGASRRALENMVQLAIDRSVDLVVIAGDLYDGDWPDQNTGLFFVAQANRLVKAGIPLAVIRGNHDAANVMTSSLPLPVNPDGSDIMLRADACDTRRFEKIGVAVHGRSFRTRAETENMALSYPAPDAGLFNLGLLHTSLTGAEGHDPYAPCTPSQLSDKNYDYWALGHVHARSSHGIEGAAPIVFSGNIQGRHIREPGAKGCVIVDIDSRGTCTPTFCPLDVVRWQMCSLDVSTYSHVDEVIDAYQERLVDAINQADQRLLVVRIELVGASKLHTQLHQTLSQLKATLRATTIAHGGEHAWLEAVRVRTTLPTNDSSPMDHDGPMESLAHVVAELRDDPEVASVVEHELRSLMKKLPPEMANPLADPLWIGQVVEAASADVMGRLTEQEATS